MYLTIDELGVKVHELYPIMINPFIFTSPKHYWYKKVSDERLKGIATVIEINGGWTVKDFEDVYNNIIETKHKSIEDTMKELEAANRNFEKLFGLHQPVIEQAKKELK